MKPSKRHLTPGEKTTIIDMLAQGDSVKTVAEYMNISVQTIYSIERRARLKDGTNLTPHRRQSVRRAKVEDFNLMEVYRDSIKMTVADLARHYNVSKVVARRLRNAGKTAYKTHIQNMTPETE